MAGEQWVHEGVRARRYRAGAAAHSAGDASPSRIWSDESDRVSRPGSLGTGCPAQTGSQRKRDWFCTPNDGERRTEKSTDENPTETYMKMESY